MTESNSWLRWGSVSFEVLFRLGSVRPMTSWLCQSQVKSAAKSITQSATTTIANHGNFPQIRIIRFYAPTELRVQAGARADRVPFVYLCPSFFAYSPYIEWDGSPPLSAGRATIGSGAAPHRAAGHLS